MIEKAFARLLEFLALIAAFLALALVLGITVDVLGRNLIRGFSVHGIDELSEYALYLITLLPAPWLVNQGQHIRVDIFMHLAPRPVARGLEMVTDLLGAAACLALAYIATNVLIDSYNLRSMVFKTFTIPEWWIYSPFPPTALLMAICFLIRFRNAVRGDALRHEGLSTY